MGKREKKKECKNKNGVYLIRLKNRANKEQRKKEREREKKSIAIVTEMMNWKEKIIN